MHHSIESVQFFNKHDLYQQINDKVDLSSPRNASVAEERSKSVV